MFLFQWQVQEVDSNKDVQPDDRSCTPKTQTCNKKTENRFSPAEVQKVEPSAASEHTEFGTNEDSSKNKQVDSEYDPCKTFYSGNVRKSNDRGGYENDCRNKLNDSLR